MTDKRTTELRDKLRERGVKYDVKALRETEWTVNGVIWHANEYDGNLNVYVRNNDMLLTPEQAIAATLGSGTLTAEQVKRIHETIEKHWHDLPAEYDIPEATALPEYSYDWQAIADELNAELGSGKAKDLLLRTFGLAQMMHDCWLEECKAGDNVDVSACNAYSYEFDQIAQAMFDMGIEVD